MSKRKPGCFDEAIYQIQGQLELDKAELKEWTPEYADYRDEHRKRIRKLRAAIKVLRECRRVELKLGPKDEDDIWMANNQALCHAILAARKLQEKGK